MALRTELNLGLDLREIHLWPNFSAWTNFFLNKYK